MPVCEVIALVVRLDSLCRPNKVWQGNRLFHEPTFSNVISGHTVSSLFLEERRIMPVREVSISRLVRVSASRVTSPPDCGVEGRQVLGSGAP
jgi:hypothetical protein